MSVYVCEWVSEWVSECMCVSVNSNSITSDFEAAALQEISPPNFCVYKRIVQI